MVLCGTWSETSVAQSQLTQFWQIPRHRTLSYSLWTPFFVTTSPSGGTWKYAKVPSTKKKLGEILYLLICSFLPCLSWLLRSRVRKSRRDLWITLYYKSTCPPHHNTTFLSRVRTNQSVVFLVWRAVVFRNSVQMISKAPQSYKSVNGRSYLIMCSLTTSEEWQYSCCGRYAVWLCWMGNVGCRWLPWRKGKGPGVNMLCMAIT